MMRRTALLLLVAVMAAGCVSAPKLPAVKTGPKVEVKTPDGKTPKTVPEWEAAVELAEQEKAAADAREKVAKDGLKQAKVRSIKRRLYWVVGVALFAALACFVAAIFLPGVRKYAIYGVIGGVALAALAWGVAAIVPYLLWIGLAILILALLAAFVYWKRDNKALRQVAEATDKYKDKLGDKLEGWRDHMRGYIDTDADRHLDSVRRYLKTYKRTD